MQEELRQAVWEANLALVRAGLVLLTWGNVSGRDPQSGLVAIKPSGVGYEGLTPAHMVLVDPQGRVVEGALRPSSDTPTHLALYRAFPELGGIAHTHSTYATAWAQALRSLPCYGTTHADHFRGEVPVTTELSAEALAGDYERETGELIVRTFATRDPRQLPGVLVAGHGPFTWGPTPAAAVVNSVVMEEVARMAAGTLRLAPTMTPLPGLLMDKHFLRKQGPNARYGQKHHD